MVIFAVQIDAPVALQSPLLRLTGLDPQARYRMSMLEHPVGHHSSTVALSRGPVTLNGAALLAQGVALLPAFPQTIAVIEGTRL